MRDAGHDPTLPERFDRHDKQEDPLDNPPILIGDLARRLASLEADPAFRMLRRSQARTNLFRVVGKTDAERWHSAFWSWLVDPEGSHGKGDFAIRQLLLRALDEDGTLPATCLRPAGKGHWSPDPSAPKLTARDLLTFEVSRSIVAPGPQSGFREICPKVQPPPGMKKDGDAGRFDILLALDGLGPKGPICLVVVLELKVNHRYSHMQLATYSSWLHEDPSVDRLKGGTPSALEFVDGYKAILSRAAQGGDIRALGVFLSREFPPPPQSPGTLVPPWKALRYRDLISAILEPLMADPELDEAALPLVRSYLDVAFAEELSMKPTDEHFLLVEALRKKHEETFRIIGRVLTDSSDPELRGTGELLAEASDAQRTESLVPRLLVDSNLASIGDTLEHSARKRKGDEKPLFEGKVVARLASGDRAGFEFVSGAGLSPADVPGQYAATGLLRKIYTFFNYPFPRNGNDCWVFTSGNSKGKTLSTVYDEVRDLDVLDSNQD